MKRFFLIALLPVLFTCKSAQPITQSPQQDISPDILSKAKKYPGFINSYWDSNDGKLWLEINQLNVEFLYVNSLVTGVGSNDIGLDRGQFGNNRIVKFIKNGPKIMLIEPNYQYRAISENKFEQNAVKEAFAQSILWGFDIKKETINGYIVDATDFYLQDVHGVSKSLAFTGQGNYQVDKSKSGIYDQGIKNFPKNTIIESLLTFKGDPKGRYVRQVVPSPEFITVRQRHSFIELPDSEYKMRKFDPRSGYFGISFMDYAVPIDKPMEQKYIVRHRLIKKNPEADVNEAQEPIIYYLDPGVPEPVRSALLEGASWWNEAFEVAGFKDAFLVKMLPEGADPMDVRYNLIQWVHRSTRGWSYGHSVIDPRTGEIIKGHVSLGSLRVRQDFLIAQGLLSPYHDGEEDVIKAKNMALARIRQLSAHEVGHTLGLAHNYASSINNRASVMDYPHPLIKLNNDGELDLSDAYDTLIGEWDKLAISYGYTEFAQGEDEKAELNKIIQKSLDDELAFISDKDSRPKGSAHPNAHLWDNNTNAADELNRVIEVRKIAMKNLGINSIPQNHPVSMLEDVMVPVYLMHRYQLEAASKIIGGLYYTYSLKGDGQTITEMVSADMQEMALSAIIKTIEPQFLEIPESLLNLLPPKALGYGSSRENFRKKTGLTFDPLAAAESASGLSIELLLNPERASRLVEYHARFPELPSLNNLIDKLVISTWKQKYANLYHAEINRAVSKLTLSEIIKLANSNRTSGQAKAVALSNIFELDDWLKSQYKKEKEENQKAHYLYGIELINRFKNNPDQFKSGEILELPMGSPIGNDLINCDF